VWRCTGGRAAAAPPSSKAPRRDIERFVIRLSPVFCQSIRRKS
jgi:hypothetical protein